jgi:hypothetical protein
MLLAFTSIETWLSPSNVVLDLVMDGELGEGCFEDSDRNLPWAGLDRVAGGESKPDREGVENLVDFQV